MVALENSDKNRAKDYLPCELTKHTLTVVSCHIFAMSADKHRVSLAGEKPDYIHAVYVNVC